MRAVLAHCADINYVSIALKKLQTFTFYLATFSQHADTDNQSISVKELQTFWFHACAFAQRAEVGKKSFLYRVCVRRS